MWLAALAVACLAAVPYGRVGGFALVNLDDYLYVFDCPVTKGLSLENLKWAFGTIGCQAIWMPATWISYMLDFSLFGGGAWVHHWVNVVLHAANAGLVFALLVRFLSDGVRPVDGGGGRGGEAAQPSAVVVGAAALGALLWAAHPLRVESVAWIASRKDVLALFWELLALMFWLRDVQESVPRETETRPGRDSVTAAWWLSLGCFAVAGMAKPTVMTFPVLAGLMEYGVSRRVRFESLLWPFLMALAIAGIAQYAQAAGGATLMLASVPLHARLANAAAAFGTYCWKTLWPVGLAVPYLHTWPAWPAFLLPGVAICAGYGAVLVWSAWVAFRWDPPWQGWSVWLPPRTVAWLRRSAGITLALGRSATTDWARILFVGLAWFLAAVAPTLGLANFGYHSHADRFTYLPAVGFSLLVAFWLRGILRRGGWMASVTCAGLMALSGVWSALSWRQAQFWQDDGTLLSHTLAVTGPDNYVAQEIFGIYIFGKTAKAEAALPHIEQEFRTSREKRRKFQAVYIFLLARAGRLEEAKAEARDFSEWSDRQRNQGIERASIMPSQSAAWLGAGDVVGPDEFTVASRLGYMAIAYYGGDREMAREHAESVLEQNSGSMLAHYILGQLALDDKRVSEAVSHWKPIQNELFFKFLTEKVNALEAK